MNGSAFRSRKPISQTEEASNMNGAEAESDAEVGTDVNEGDVFVKKTPIIVVFRSIRYRNLFLKNYRRVRNLFFDKERKNQIYVHELLTPNRRRLLYNAKLFCKANNFKYFWTNNGNVFVRRADGEKCFQINIHTDLTSIGGTVAGETGSI